MLFSEFYPDYFTATILEWKHLLKQDKYKDIIISSLEFLVKNGRIKVYGFTIMSNHIHLIWQVQQRLSAKGGPAIVYEIHCTNDNKRSKK